MRLIVIPLQMISRQVFPDLDKIVDQANWDIAKTDSPPDVKEMREALEAPDRYMGGKQYSIVCRLLNSRFNDKKIPVHLNETFFCQYCESDRFLGITCKSVSQIMQAYGEDLAL